MEPSGTNSVLRGGITAASFTITGSDDDDHIDALGVATGAFSWLVPGPSAGDGSVPAAEAGRGAVVVEAGDSYWSIARSLQPLGDVRPLVHQLQVLNRGVELQPGMAVRLPTQ